MKQDTLHQCTYVIDTPTISVYVVIIINILYYILVHVFVHVHVFCTYIGHNTKTILNLSPD